MSVDGPIQLLKARGFSVSGLARARGLDHVHMHNAIRGKAPLQPDEVLALVDALGLPITEVLPDPMLRKALR